MTKVFITPGPSQVDPGTGIGQVVLAQYKYLPAYGIELAEDERHADVVACHVTDDTVSRVDVLHCHGLYWTAEPDSGKYDNWHYELNARVARAARRALAITVPSRWVAMPFKRDMRLTPYVIGHGINLDEWQVGEPGGYVLWNKNRPTDVCSPEPLRVFYDNHIPVKTTFAPDGCIPRDDFSVLGVMPFDKMQGVVAGAAVYLATTKETDGIGTREALACGVPVLGYNHGGTAEIVKHKETGYLVEPGDTAGLLEGYAWIMENRTALSLAAREYSEAHTWATTIQQYADLYNHVAERAREPQEVAVVVTNYNYGRFVADAIESVLAQETRFPLEVIVVDDGSTDDSRDVIDRYAERVTRIYKKNGGVASARNAGIASAGAQFIVCLDADDMLHKDYVEILATRLAAEREIGIAYSNIVIVNHDGTTQAAAWPPEFSWKIQATPHVPPMNVIPCASMFRRAMWERAGGYRQEYAPAEDTEFFTRGLSVGFIAERVTTAPLFRYRVHKDSASRTRKYSRIDAFMPWMRDKDYPFGAPAPYVRVRSYSEPLISVIIPVGPGHEEAVWRAIESVVGQTLRNTELIVVDDSPNGIPARILQPYPFIRAMTTGGGKGAGAARNLGLSVARGEYTLFLDADDVLMGDALMHLAQALVNNPDARYAYSEWALSSGGAIETQAAQNYTQERMLRGLLHPVSALIHTEDAIGVKGFDESLQTLEDWDFYAKLSASGVCGVCVHEPLLVYNVDSGGRRHIGTDETLRQQARELVAARYGVYLQGGKTMTNCCGGSGGAILKAKKELGVQIMNEIAEPGENPWLASRGKPLVLETAKREVHAPAFVRMEFTGMRKGSIPYRGINGSNREYLGADTAKYKYANVHPDDVDKLKLSGDWRVVSRGPVVPAQGPILEPQRVTAAGVAVPTSLRFEEQRKVERAPMPHPSPMAASSEALDAVSDNSVVALENDGVMEFGPVLSDMSGQAPAPAKPPAPAVSAVATAAWPEARLVENVEAASGVKVESDDAEDMLFPDEVPVTKRGRKPKAG